MAKSKEQVIEELAKVRFVGPAMARKLYDGLEIRSLDDLVAAGEAGRLTEIPGIGARKEEQILQSARRQVASRAAHADRSAASKKAASKESASKKSASKKSASGAAKADASKAADKPAKLDASAPRPAPAPSSRAARRGNGADRSAADEKAAAKPRTEPRKASTPAEGPAAERPAAGAGASQGGVSTGGVGAASAASEGAASRGSASPRARVRPASLRQRFIDTLRCPACGHDQFSVTDTSITCMACQRQFNVQNGIADLAPPHIADRTIAQRLMDMRLYAQFYEDVMRPRLTGVISDRSMREEYRLSADMLDLEQDVRLLDVGCGTANFTRYFGERLGLAEANIQPNGSPLPLLVGMDLSWSMLETARSYLRREGLDEKVFLLRGDATRIPIKRGAYNRLHCAGSLHMMSDIDEALRNFARVLEPEGICVIGTFILGEGLMRRFLKRVTEVPTRIHWFSREELHRRMERAGFEILDESIAGDAITLKARRI